MPSGGYINVLGQHPSEFFATPHPQPRLVFPENATPSHPMHEELSKHCRQTYEEGPGLPHPQPRFRSLEPHPQP